MRYTHREIAVGVVLLLSGFWGPTGCSDDPATPKDQKPPPEVLDSAYQGTLTPRLTNASLPAIDGSASLSVGVDNYARMTFGTATLSYDATDDNGQFKIRRNGTLTPRPTSKYFDNGGQDYFDVKENTALNE